MRRLAIVPSEVAALWPLQPTAGRFEVVGDDDIRFIPRFPFVAGTPYSLLVDGAEVARVVAPPARAAESTHVVAIYPTAREVPLNLLKVYIRFSAPMSEGWAARAVQVHRADDGQPLEGVFLPAEPELWDPGRRRLTLLLDPGRIKRGLAPHEELGYPLQEGSPIAVRVDRSFRDASGVPLLCGVERRYEVGLAVRRHITPADWSIHPPSAQSTDPLRVDFDRPLDRALLEHALTVVDPHGGGLDGAVTIAEGERSWSFTPLRPWRATPYRLAVDARLEDLAGNSLTRVFDRDLSRAQDTPLEIKQAYVPIRPR